MTIKKKIKNSSNPILLLDIDGVLKIRDEDGDLENYFNQNCVYFLNEIIIETDCLIILSSDWRLHYSLKVIGEIFQDEGIIKKPIDYTPDFWTKTTSIYDCEKIRKREILDWLKKNPTNKWCAVDDMKLELDNFVQCDSTKGITKNIKDKIVKFLK